jgi:chitodextrinase
MRRFVPNVLSFALLGAAVLGLAMGPTSTLPASATASAASPTWWKVDTHEHSTISGDARADLGVISAKAQAAGYNAVFLTDHDRAASFSIDHANGNYLDLTDTLGTRWTQRNKGTLSGFANSIVSSPVHSGTGSLHVNAASSSTGQSFVYARRGRTPLRAGTITLDFWVYPQQISGNAGVDVSVALGGDGTAAAPYGYTNSAGTTMLGKSTVLVWQLGSARASSQSGSTRVYSNSLSYSPGTWNHYVINVTSGNITWTPQGGATTNSTGTGLDTLDPADRPAGHTVLAYPKIEAAVTGGGTADAYIDDYVFKDEAPNCPAADFAYRNSLLNQGQFDGPNFKLFPSREMGQNNHSNQFNFGITNPGDYFDNYNDTSVPTAYGNDGALCSATNNSSAPWKFSKLGADNITDVQASGYPAQNNHPGVTDDLATVVSTKAHGADAVELQTSEDYSKTWDDILQQNHILMGTYGRDAHEGAGGSAPSNYIDAPSLNLDDLMHSYFEGRMYQAPANFTGRIVFNVDNGSRPYPARYPILVAPTATSTNVRLSISQGLSAGNLVRWITNSGSGLVTTDIPVSGTSYDEVRSIPLTGSFTYVRAEIRDASDNLVANTQPIFFRSLNGLPNDKSVHVDSVTPSSGCACSVAKTKGITTSSWAANRLTLGLTNTAGSTVNLLGTSADAPAQVVMDGSAVSQSPSLSEYQAQTGDAWYYDAGTHHLYLQDRQSGSTSSLVASFDTTTDDAPSVPSGLSGAASGSSSVDLSWSASTDGDATPVAGYHVFRDGSRVGDVTGRSFTDTGLSANTTYDYTVSAYDTAGLESAQSDPVSVKTGGAASGTFTPVADAYVVSGDSVNRGTQTLLKADASPETNSYLRFTASGLSGSSVKSAVLKVYTTSALSAGFSVRTTSGGWSETGIVFANAPAYSSTGVNSSGTTANAYVSVDVTSLVTKTSGDINLAVVGRSSTNLSMNSREGANKPQLVITTE